jgi:hypothetical protein
MQIHYLYFSSEVVVSSNEHSFTTIFRAPGPFNFFQVTFGRKDIAQLLAI